MEHKYYVYEWYIVNTGEVFYVGKGCGRRYKTLTGRNQFFLDMYKTHHCDVRFVKTDLTEEEAYRIEYLTVQFYKTYTSFRLTNQTDGGDGTRGHTMSDEGKAKISRASTAMWSNEEWKREIISRRRLPTSTYQSKEFKEKMSSIVSGERNPNFGHYWTTEMKEAFSIKQKASGRYNGAQNPNAKRIQCVETGEIFDCIMDAKNQYNIKSVASFSVAIDKPTRTAGGLHWVSITS